MLFNSRMQNLRVTQDEAPPPKGFHPSEYASNALFMFGGEVESYTICCDWLILQDVIDRLGDHIIIAESDDKNLTAIVKATTGGIRLWAIHYIETCRVLSREWLVKDVKSAIKKGTEKYSVNADIP